MNGAQLHSSDSANTIRRETTTWVRWTEDGKLQQRWWIEEETTTSHKAYEEWRDVPTLATSSG